MGKKSLAAAALAAAAGCANLLGFEDIAVVPDDAGARDEVSAVTPDASVPRCRPTSRPVRKRALASLGTDASLELTPRLTRDERTIMFLRISSELTGGLVARRASSDADFGAPERVFPELDPPTHEVMPTADGTRLYFTRLNARDRVIRTALVVGADPTVLAGVGSFDAIEPFYSERTRELFFARVSPDAGFQIHRAIGEGATFDAPAVVDELVVGGVRDHGYAFVTEDGLRLYFSTFGQEPDGTLSLRFGRNFLATRERPAPDAPFRVEPLDVVGDTARIGWVSPDECRLYTQRADDTGIHLFLEEREPE